MVYNNIYQSYIYRFEFKFCIKKKKYQKLSAPSSEAVLKCSRSTSTIGCSFIYLFSKLQRIKAKVYVGPHSIF